MNNDAKERLREYVENDDIYTEYKSGKCDMSDFDKFCIEHCKDIECLLNEVQEYKEVIDKAIKILEKGITFCKNDSQGIFDICNVSIAREERVLNILKEVVINE